MVIQNIKSPNFQKSAKQIQFLHISSINETEADPMIKKISSLLVVFAILLSAGCGQQASPAENAAKDTGAVKEFVIESFTEIIDGKYYPKFSPNEITANKGDLVRIKITNTKGTHDFKIDEFGVYAETPLDQEVTVEFVADNAGSFEYYCTKPGHRQNGQLGTLKVIE